MKKHLRMKPDVNLQVKALGYITEVNEKDLSADSDKVPTGATL